MNTDKVPSEYSISPTSGVRSSSGLSPVSNTLVIAKLLVSGSVALRTMKMGGKIKAATLHLIQTWIIFVEHVEVCENAVYCISALCGQNGQKIETGMMD